MTDALPPVTNKPPAQAGGSESPEGMTNSRILVIVGGTMAILLIGLVIGGLVGSNVGNSETKTVTVTAQDKTSGQAADSPTGANVSRSPSGALKVGQTGDVAGTFGITLDSFDKLSSDGGVTKFRAVTTVKNLASVGIDPFCGGRGAILMDSQGREFVGESVIDGDTLNCGDEIGPGLTKGPYAMDFELPSDASPSELKLCGGGAYEKHAASWDVS